MSTPVGSAIAQLVRTWLTEHSAGAEHESDAPYVRADNINYVLVDGDLNLQHLGEYIAQQLGLVKGNSNDGDN